MTLTLNNT